ncbi:ABC transporter substrate-binding protein [Methyloversatilis sp.]|uniref:ABC transporter substrate-binding protein n=1 Tax=Methyloversatilis sp. TaxID=2569862 RepID=UPI003F6E6AE6
MRPPVISRFAACRRAWAWAWLGACVALGLAGAGATGAATAAPLTLAVAQTPQYAALLLAEREGYYAAEGLDVKTVTCINGFQCMQLLRAGSVQAATVADTPIVFAAHAGLRFDIIATLERSSAESKLIGRADRGVRSAADLKGRRVGFLRGTVSHYYLDTFLLLSGVDAALVQRVPLEYTDVVGALVRGEIDAVSLNQPNAARALAALGPQAVVLPMARVYTLAAHLISLPADQGVSDDTLQRLLRAVLRGQQLLEQQPSASRAWLAQRLKLEPAVARAAFDDMNFRIDLDQSLLATLESQSRWAQREGLVPAGPLPDYLARVRAGPLQSVAPRAVNLAR